MICEHGMDEDDFCPCEQCFTAYRRFAELMQHFYPRETVAIWTMVNEELDAEYEEENDGS